MTTIPLQFLGEDFILEAEYRVTYWGAPATYYDPPEGPEFEITSLFLIRDNLGEEGPAFAVTGALFSCLAKLPKLTDKICEEIWEAHYNPEYF
jgi:hypothetical protein